MDCGDDITPVGRHFIIIGAMKAGHHDTFRHADATFGDLPHLGRSARVGTSKEINYLQRVPER